MLKVVAFMKQVAEELRMGGNFGTAHVYRSSINAIIAYHGEGDFSFDEVTPEWLKGFEVHLRGRGCSWNTVSTYLRTFRAVYNVPSIVGWLFIRLICSVPSIRVRVQIIREHCAMKI